MCKRYRRHVVDHRVRVFRDVLASHSQLLVLEGFSSIKEIDGSPLEEITKIDGFDADTAKELKERAKEYLETESKEISNRVKELGIQDDLMATSMT